MPCSTELECRPAYELTFPALADLVTRGYAGYLGGPIQFDEHGLARLVSQHGIDLWLSRVVTQAGLPIGFGLVQRVGAVARLGGFAILASHRRIGAGQFLLRRLLRESAERGERAMMLEVIQSNAPALALYQGHGFRIVDELHGWRLSAPRPLRRHTPVQLVEAAVADLPVHGPDFPALPWQISRHAAAKAPIGARCFLHAGAGIVVTDVDRDPIRILAAFPSAGSPDPWEPVRLLVESLAAQLPERNLWAPAVFPADRGGLVFEPTGFQRDPLPQFLMRRDTPARTPAQGR